MQGDPTDMNPSPAHTRLRRALPLVVALAIGAAAGAGAYALSSHGSKTPSAAPVVVPAQPASSTSSVDSLTQLYNEDAPGVTECHVAGATGLVVDGDAGTIAAAIEALLRDPGRRAAMGEAAAKRIREHYSMEANRQRFLALYAELTARG